MFALMYYYIALTIDIDLYFLGFFPVAYNHMPYFTMKLSMKNTFITPDVFDKNHGRQTYQLAIRHGRLAPCKTLYLLPVNVRETKTSLS